MAVLEQVSAGSRVTFEVNGLIDIETGAAFNPPPSSVTASARDARGEFLFEALMMTVDPNDAQHYVLEYQLADDAYPGRAQWQPTANFSGAKAILPITDAFEIVPILAEIIET